MLRGFELDESRLPEADRLRERLAAAPAGSREELLRDRLAADPTDVATWRRLGQALWERAVAGRDERVRREAEAAWDLARLLAWPWPDGPPLVDEERMHWTRLGFACERLEPTGADPVGLRRAALAFLAAPALDAEWLARFYQVRDEALAAIGPVAAFWIEQAVLDRVNDREEQNRRRERLAQHAVAVPEWLRESYRRDRRTRLKSRFGQLRDAARNRPVALDLFRREDLAEVALRLPATDLPTALARAALPLVVGQVPGPGQLAVWLRFVAVARRQSRLGEPSFGQELSEAARRLRPGPVRELLAGRPLTEAAPDRLQRLHPRLRRAVWLRALAPLAEWAEPGQRLAVATELLRLADDLPRREVGRRASLAARVLARAELPYPELRALLEPARRGWSTAEDHDRIELAVIRCLLRHAAEMPEALERARHHSTLIERGLARGEAALLLAEAYREVEPEAAVRLARDAFRRGLAEPAEQPAVWTLKIAAARRLAAWDHPEGPALLFDLERRLRPRAHPRLRLALLEAVLERPEPEADAAADRLARPLRGIWRGWAGLLRQAHGLESEPRAIAKLRQARSRHLADWLLGLLAAEAGAGRLRAPFATSLLATLAEATQPAGAPIAAAVKRAEPADVAVLAGWHEELRDGGRALVLALLGELLEQRVAQEAARAAAAAEHALSVAWRERVSG